MSHISKIQKLASASYKVSRLVLTLLKPRDVLVIFSFNLEFRKWHRLFLTSLDTFYFINVALSAWKKRNNAVIAIFALTHSNLVMGFVYSQNTALQLISGPAAWTTLSFLNSWWLTTRKTGIELPMELTSSYSSWLVDLGTDIFSAPNYSITDFFKIRWYWGILVC